MAIEDVTDKGATSLRSDLDPAQVRRIGLDRQALLRRFHRQREADRHAVARFAGRRLLDAEDILMLEEHINTERRARLAYQQLDVLSPKDRELVHLVDVVGLTPAEAASATGLRPGMARVRLFRARAKLRTALQLSEESP